MAPAGAFLFSFPRLIQREGLPDLARPALLFSFCTLGAYLIANRIPFDFARISWDRWQFFYLFLFSLVCAVPLFFSGLTVSLALTRLGSSCAAEREPPHRKEGRKNSRKRG